MVNIGPPVYGPCHSDTTVSPKYLLGILILHLEVWFLCSSYLNLLLHDGDSRIFTFDRRYGVIGKPAPPPATQPPGEYGIPTSVVDENVQIPIVEEQFNTLARRSPNPEVDALNGTEESG